LRSQPNDSHFEILCITRLATKAEIKKAFRQQIKKWHPDKFHGLPEKILHAHEMSKKIIEAFERLENYVPPTNFASNSTDKLYSKKQPASTFTKPASPPKANRLDILRIKVKSSNIHSVGYDTTLKVLQVEFLNGNIYQYYNVPEHNFNELLKADSKGKFLNCKISFHFRYECV
jgi:hypothetical protein